MLSSVVRSFRSQTLYKQISPRASYIHISALVQNAAVESTTTTTVTPATNNITPINSRKPSSAPKGTVLKGLQYVKDQPDPVALDDSEYPEWLWDLLDEKKIKQKSNKPASRQFHRKQSRDSIKAMNFMKDKKN